MRPVCSELTSVPANRSIILLAHLQPTELRSLPNKILFRQNFFKDPWNTFDFITVIGSIVDAMVVEFGVSCFWKISGQNKYCTYFTNKYYHYTDNTVFFLDSSTKVQMDKIFLFPQHYRIECYCTICPFSNHILLNCVLFTSRKGQRKYRKRGYVFIRNTISIFF
jgi:hypothetical protein